MLTKLKLRAKKILQIVKAKYLKKDEEVFLEEHAAANLLLGSQEDKNKTLYDFLKETYLEIAESDPEAALAMIKTELEEIQDPPIEKALIEIEVYIRQKYAKEYFGGMRVKNKAE